VLDAAVLLVCTMLTTRLVDAARSLLEAEITLAVMDIWQLEQVIPFSGIVFTTGQPVHPANSAKDATMGWMLLVMA
jgi:hypothetical protein